MGTLTRRDFTRALTLGAGAAALATPRVTTGQPRPKAGWALVGLGTLATTQVLPAFALAGRSSLAALVSGDRDKARDLARSYGVQDSSLYTYDDIGRLRDDRRVDVVYILLPNSMHAEFTIKALEAGKHVLCEKPMAVTSAECERMIAAARQANRTLMIAYRLHYEPHTMKAVALCRDDEIGALRMFTSNNSQYVVGPGIRLTAALGGGPLLDVGIYTINAARAVIGEEPESVTAVANRPTDDERFREVDASVAFTLRYPSGVLAHCATSFDSAESQFFRVDGTKGSVILDRAFHYEGQRLRSVRERRGEEPIALEPVNHFVAEMDHLSACVLDGGGVRTPGEMGLADVRIIEAINEAARTGTRVAVRR